MIHYTPYPILFSVNGFQVYSSSFFLSAGALISYLHGRREVVRSGLDPDFFTGLAVYALIGAFLGARIYVIITTMNFAPELLLKSFLFRKEGASIGGFLGAMALAVAYAAVKKNDFLRYADAIAPAVVLGIGVVRIGCFLNWDDYGTQCTRFWGVFVEDCPRHPTQIYEALFCLTLFFFLSFVKRRNTYDGRTFFIMLIGYGWGRFFIEFFRDSGRYWMNLTVTQVVILAVMAGLVVASSMPKGFFSQP